MAVAIMPPMSLVVAGMIIVLLDLARWPNWVMYCSATRNCTASVPPGLCIAAATSRIPSAVARATAMMAEASPSASLICC